MQVWVQGCPTLYKSQVVLSIKDTPLVPKLCITSQHDRVLHRPPVILPPAPHLPKPVRRIQRARRSVRPYPASHFTWASAGRPYTGSATLGSPIPRRAPSYETSASNDPARGGSASRPTGARPVHDRTSSR